MTASGTPIRPGTSAADPIVPSPPATASRSGSEAAARSSSSSSQPKTSTSAPWSRMAAASGAGSSPPPEARLAARAIRTDAEGTLAFVFGAIDHVGVAVEDLDAAIAVHRDVYGLPLVHRETVE